VQVCSFQAVRSTLQIRSKCFKFAFATPQAWTDSTDIGCDDIRVADPSGVTLAFHTEDIVADIDIISPALRDSPAESPNATL
jgi:hypothetical protein